MSKFPVITIDGPSGTGKGTIGQLIAKALGWHLLDSGAIYRVLALSSAWHAVDSDDEDKLTKIATNLEVRFIASALGEAPRVILEGKDVTEEIRSEIVGSMASKIGALPKVREALLERQRAFCEAPGLVTDGRDMGTVVFPDAIVKIYLVASTEERAQRRFNQLLGMGVTVTLARVFEDLEQRDLRDSQRVVAPLKPAKDAHIIDTTGLKIEQVLNSILQIVRSKLGQLS